MNTQLIKRDSADFTLNELTWSARQLQHITGTHLINATEPTSSQKVSGAPGKWYLVDGSLVGIDLPQPFSTTGIVQLRPWEYVDDGKIILSAIRNDSHLALRILAHGSTEHYEFLNSRESIVSSREVADLKAH